MTIIIELEQTYFPDCNFIGNACYDLVKPNKKEYIVPLCNVCNSVLRPDVVLFREIVPTNLLNRSLQLISDADVLIVAGSAMDASPAADLARYAKYLNNFRVQYKIQ